MQSSTATGGLFQCTIKLCTHRVDEAVTQGKIFPAIEKDCPQLAMGTNFCVFMGTDIALVRKSNLTKYLQPA
jgi:hypothetical protein